MRDRGGGRADPGACAVLADLSFKPKSPNDWARRAIAAMQKFHADRLVAEVNQGGDMVKTIIATLDPLIPFTGVHAARGKAVRAEPVAALYEQGRVTHAAGLQALEDQMCRMTHQGYRGSGSPDRVDALVWAIFELMLAPLAAATPGILDHGAPLVVELTRGSLSGVTPEALLAGANLAAIGDGSQDNWEIFQFQSADLVAPGRYELSGRLRGQLGSDALMPAQWPVGSYFVLLDGTPEQIELAASGRNTLQYFQIGPAARPYSDYSYRKLSAAFAGNGLRPYAPVHLAQKWDGADLEFSWIRRARLDGASWDLAEIPLAETQERYQVKIFSGAQLLRLEEVHQTQWRYSAAMQSLDGVQGLLELQVAQLSESFGPGLRRKFRFTI